MKKLFLLLVLLAFCTNAFAAKKITELTETSTPSSDDIFAVVDDPAGSPVTKKLSFANTETLFETLLDLQDLQGAVTDAQIPNDITINTATALAANGANCSSGNSPLGVDASGAVESCFDVATQTELSAAIDNTAYDSAVWDGDTTHAPSKNTVRDVIESLSVGGSSYTFGKALTESGGTVNFDGEIATIYGSALTAAATVYGNSCGAFSSTSGRHNIIPMAFAGTAKNLYAKVTTAPGASKTDTITVYKNGSATALTCNITGAGVTSCSDTSNTFTFAAGDTIGAVITFTSSPANPGDTGVTFMLQAD